MAKERNREGRMALEMEPYPQNINRERPRSATKGHHEHTNNNTTGRAMSIVPSGPLTNKCYHMLKKIFYLSYKEEREEPLISGGKSLDIGKKAIGIYGLRTPHVLLLKKLKQASKRPNII